MRVLGLDLSLTCTGYARCDGTPGHVTCGTAKGAKRLSAYADAVSLLVNEEGPDLVAIEGYSYGSAVSQAHSLGELGGVVRMTLHEMLQPFVVVPPATAKKYATGNGNANKMAMVIAARERLGYLGQQEDEADALWVRATVLAAAGYSVVTVPKAHLEALTATRSGKKKHPPFTERVAEALQVV